MAVRIVTATRHQSYCMYSWNQQLEASFWIHCSKADCHNSMIHGTYAHSCFSVETSALPHPISPDNLPQPRVLYHQVDTAWACCLNFPWPPYTRLKARRLVVTRMGTEETRRTAQQYKTQDRRTVHSVSRTSLQQKCCSEDV